MCAELTAGARLLQEFVPAAKELEQGNWTRFTPHYMVSPCPPMYQGSAACSSQCVQDGKYCAPDPDGSILEGYSGAEVVQVPCQPVACRHYIQPQHTFNTRRINLYLPVRNTSKQII